MPVDYTQIWLKVKCWEALIPKRNIPPKTEYNIKNKITFTFTVYSQKLVFYCIGSHTAYFTDGQ